MQADTSSQSLRSDSVFLHVWWCGCSVSWHLCRAKLVMLLLGGLNVTAVALASVIVSAVPGRVSAVLWSLVNIGFSTWYRREEALQGNKARLTLCTSILLPLRMALLERQG